MTSEPSGNLWRATCREQVPAAPLAADTTADLVIVGGGYTGCAAALAAAGRGARVCLLEAHEIGHGGSGRNVGLVNAGLWLPPEAIVSVLGEHAGQRLLDELGQAPERVFGLIERHGIECEATRNGTLHCAHSDAGLRDLESRFRQQNCLGAPVRLLDAEETRRRTGSPGFHGALFDPRAGTIQPLAYVRGLARAAVDAGARVYQNTAVRRIGREDSAWRVETAGGSVTAARMLLATNAYHEGCAGAEGAAYVPVHYFQLATAPLSPADRARVLPGGEGCWDTALVMSSFRLDRAGRLIVGAIGNLEGAGGRIHAAWARRKIASLFPGLSVPAIEHAWCGRIAMTGDHVPRVRRIGPGAYACYGYSGRGIGPGTVFGTRTALSLLDDDPTLLPLPAVEGHDETFRAMRAAYYEAGATLTHAVAARG